MLRWWCGGSSSGLALPSDPGNAESNADLASLSVFFGDLSPVFDPNILRYDLTLPESSNNISFEVTLSDSGSLLSIDNVTQTLGLISIPFDTSINTLSIVIDVRSADGGVQKRYTLAVSRSDQSDNTKLSYLEISSGELTLAFSAQATNYLANIPFLRNSIVFRAMAEDENAQMSLLMNGLKTTFTGEREIEIPASASEIIREVRAEDLISLTTYRVTFSRASLEQLGESALVKAEEVSPEDRFGYSTDIENDTLVVGAIAAGNLAADAGAAYVYDVSEGGRRLMSLIEANNA